MKSFVHIVFISLGLSWAAASVPIAQAQDLAAAEAAPPRSVFSVSDIAVDVSAASAAAARAQAVALAHRLAFERVFQKMVASEDWSAQPALTNGELAGLVSALDVSGEKSSQTRYGAQLSVTFDKDAMLSLFSRLGVTYTDSETPPIILLPIANYAGVKMLWEGDNVWGNAWQASATRAQSLVNYDLLPATPIYMSQMSALGAREAKPEQLIALIRSKTASDIVLAYAEISFDLASGRYIGRFDIRRGPQQSAFMAFDIVQGPSQSPPQMLENAIALIDQELSALWKRQLLVEYAQATDVRIAADFDVPNEWRTILNAMTKARRLRNVAINTLALQRADLGARFFGDFAPLAENMANEGVVLERETTTRWRARVMTASERSSLQMNTLTNAVEGYVDPFDDELATGDTNAAAMPNNFETAPWEMGTPKAGQRQSVPSQDTGAAFQP